MVTRTTPLGGALDQYFQPVKHMLYQGGAQFFSNRDNLRTQAFPKLT
jgi:hypothetical protein